MFGVVCAPASVTHPSASASACSLGDRLYTRPPAAPYYSQPAHVLALQHTDSQTQMLFNSSIKKGMGAKFGRFESVGTARCLFIKSLLLLTDFALTLSVLNPSTFGM